MIMFLRFCIIMIKAMFHTVIKANCYIMIIKVMFLIKIKAMFHKSLWGL